MIPKFDDLLKGWISIPLKSGFFFWIGGMPAYICSIGGLSEFMKQYKNLGDKEIGLFVFAAVFVMAASMNFLSYLIPMVLRFLEGYYWPQWLRSKWITIRHNRRFRQWENRFQALDNKQKTAEEEREYIRLYEKLKYLPDLEERMPTDLGNYLRSVELRPQKRYGLNPFVCWAHLWLILPDKAQKELNQARDNLDTAAHLWIWSVLFMIWGFWALWAIPIGMLSACLSYLFISESAKIYGQLVEAAFDLYHPLLLKELLPANPDENRQKGEQLTRYLWRGF